MDHPLDQIKPEEIVSAIPSELQRIIYTYFLLKLRDEKHFNLLAHMNTSHTFRSYAIFDILPKIRHESKIHTTISLSDSTYEMISMPNDNFLLEMKPSTELNDFDTDNATDALTRILYTIFSIAGKDSVADPVLGASATMDSVVKLVPINSNKTKLSATSLDESITAIVNIEGWICNDLITRTDLPEEKIIGLKVHNIDHIFPHVIKYSNPSTNYSVADNNFRNYMENEHRNMLSLDENSSDDETDAESKLNDNIRHPYRSEIPAYMFLRTYDKIVVCKDSAYFINPYNVGPSHVEYSIPITFPQMVFDMKIVMGVECIVQLYNFCAKTNKEIVYRNNSSGFTMGNIDSTNISCQSERYGPLDDYCVKTGSEWINHILPIMNIIDGCSFYIKKESPMVVELLIRYSKHSNFTNKMYILVSLIE